MEGLRSWSAIGWGGGEVPSRRAGCVRGTFSPWPLSLVDRADSLLLNVGEWLGSNLNAIRELRPSYCRYVHWWNCPRLSAASEKVPRPLHPPLPELWTSKALRVSDPIAKARGLSPG